MTGSMKSLPLSKIAELLRGSPVGHGATNDGADNLQIVSVTFNSSAVIPGSLFVAIRGTTADGHSFVADAFKHGAVAAVVEDRDVLGAHPGVVVANTRLALSRLASAFNDNPSAALGCVGITGTNGKTTTNWIIYHVLNQLSAGCQRIGTLGSECMGVSGQVGSLTSPDPLSIHRLLSEAVSMGAKYSVIETSSHALDQARVADIEFDVGVFTNLTRDHLDYHGTMERYFEAKAHLFELLARGAKATRGAVINRDAEYGERLLRELPRWGLTEWSFGSSPGSSLRMISLDESADTLSIEIEDSHAKQRVTLVIPCIGRHNAENALAAYGACRALGFGPGPVCEAMARIPQVPGRLERVGNQEPRVFVDYAHTPDALMRVLQAVRPTTRGQVWVVFGCGGDRDRGKRPQMAAVASDFADQVVITSDNPRTESPQTIMNDILIGAAGPRLVELDRRKAIFETLSLASRDDTVVIAGKGHEDYQIIGAEKIHFSDQEVAREALVRSRTWVGDGGR